MESANVKSARAEGRFLRTGARKVNRVLELIRGKHVSEAMAILRFTPKRAARLIEKVVASAVANAENNHDMDRENLYIARAFVEQGPTIPRIIHMSMGRIGRIRKRTCHTTIVVQEKTPPVSESKKAGEKKDASGKETRVATAKVDEARAKETAKKESE